MDISWTRERTQRSTSSSSSRDTVDIMLRSLPETRSRTKNLRMARKIEDIMDLCCEISAEFKVTKKNSTKGAAMAGGGAFVGALLGGPPGMLIGGIAGSVLGWLTSDEFKPLPEVLMELTPAQKKLLCDEIAAVLSNLDRRDADQLIDLVMGTAVLLKFMKKFA